jgi:hypothetical protein
MFKRSVNRIRSGIAISCTLLHGGLGLIAGATRTAIWEKLGKDMATLPPRVLVEVDEMVDAVLVGLDRGGSVTIPSRASIAEWGHMRRHGEHDVEARAQFSCTA